MIINNFQPTSLIDMPECIACVVYTQGCNRHCTYCHNPETISQYTPGRIAWQLVEQYLIKRIGLLDAIVFSGGEPTLQKDLIEKIFVSKNLGFKVGLHTNGDGKMFEEACELVDYILLSHFTDEKLKLAAAAPKVYTSEVVKSSHGLWENKIERVK